jgi:DNA-binding response OmpR family regulator
MTDSTTSPEERVAEALRAVWTNSKPEIEARAATVEKAVAAALASELDEATRAEAERAAHRLAGSLGTLGVSAGSDVARELEVALGTDPLPQAELPRLAGLANELRELVAAGPGAVPAPAEAPAETPPSNGRRILAVDDDQSVLGAVDAVLSDNGYDVETLDDPLRIADALAERPVDALLLDVNMPGIDGLEACRRLRADGRWSALPILVLTARNDAETVNEVFAAGADDFLAKPISGPQLLARLENRLARAEAQRASAPAPAGREATVDIVVVEDDTAIADLLLHALETRGYRTRWIDDGASAWTLLGGERPEIAPRLVLLDVDLPGINGLTLLRRLAREGVLGRTRVIMLTARAGEREVVAALELGAVDHVAKPFSLPVLLERVRATLARA